MLQRALNALSRTTAFGWLVACNPIVVDAFDEPDAQIESIYIDRCPSDVAKTLPGICGCGIPDDDFDRDGAPDCSEQCPDNPARTSPLGPCGCSDFGDTLACSELRDALGNLYAFNGAGLQIIDTRSGSDGLLAHALAETPANELGALQVNGRLNFDGLGSYVDLPDRLVSALTSATFEAWLIWRGGAFWTRIFDFGNSDDVSGQTYLFLTPSNSENGALRAAYSLGGGEIETVVDGVRALDARAMGGTPEHVAVVIDEVAGVMQLYRDGEQVGSAALVDDLAAIDDTNNWLGRSNYFSDPPMSGSLLEFRIYERALSAEQIRTSFQAGPGALDD